ncbi:F-box/FBD/LRR-repeat protein At4g26340-like [Chenopodium quinoa]|uniref:F-box/FBD/LRR-repeat protein At4g26340-like n=1 Tax=Chenopodium quinoa TaxID=63459 RepID=UPI000B79704D|nr:F-box/FBD/LRR-repeat protein At4g26340-like [Chenopodium quinoa]
MKKGICQAKQTGLAGRLYVSLLTLVNFRCRKRPKRDENNAVKDRISNLPDHVLLDNILSYLPTKDVVATSLLSRRWRRLFTGVTRLDCDDSPISHCAEHPHLTELFPTFKMFVDNMLQACQSTITTTFRLHLANTNLDCNVGTVGYCYDTCYPEFEGVKKLDIHIRVREPDKLPSAIFNCRTLEVLKLDVNLDLEVPSTLCLPNLKELHISVVCFPIDDSLTRLVSSCPSLEYMTLCGSLSPVIPISISSHSLRTLKLNTFFCSSILGSKLVLDVPNLEYLWYVDDCAPCSEIQKLQ